MGGSGGGRRKRNPLLLQKAGTSPASYLTIMDPLWGHVTIKMSGHPPFGAQIILNGHEFVARQAGAAGIAFSKAGNCFTAVADPAGLARIADALSQDAAVGRLSQLCQRWIYSACLCFGLDLDEQLRSGFVYGFAVYQLEYSRNLIFADGHRMQRVFDAVVDRTRSRLDVPKIRTVFGTAQRPRRTRRSSSVIEAAIETPSYDLTVFKLHFGRLTGKAYTKGERVLRFEAIVHNTAELRCARMIEHLPEIVSQLAGIADRFCTALDCVDTGFIADGILDELPTGVRLGATRVGGVDLNKTRMRDGAARRPGAGASAERVHRRRVRCQGARPHRCRSLRLHRAPGRLRPAQAAGQTPRRQTRPNPPLPRPAPGCAHHRRPAHPPRPGHRPDPRRDAQPTHGTQTRALDTRRP